MSNVVDHLTGHLTGALYRVGLRDRSGESSLVSLAARPARLTVGEVAASLADLMSARRSSARESGPGATQRPAEMGPSTV